MEEETPSWKGHSFTLLVFTGIVVLCSIFFVLGMLVGRSQGQRIAEIAAAEEGAKNNQAQPLPETSLDYFKQTTAAAVDEPFTPAIPAPTTAEPSTASTPAAAPPPKPPEPESVLPKPTADKPYLQIVATKDMKEADKARVKVQSKGFKAIIVPADPGKNAMNRVWVGPFESKADAEMAKTELEAQGFKKPFIPK
jgi:cell division septation protein DedD